MLTKTIYATLIVILTMGAAIHYRGGIRRALLRLWLPDRCAISVGSSIADLASILMG